MDYKPCDSMCMRNSSLRSLVGTCALKIMHLPLKFDAWAISFRGMTVLSDVKIMDFLVAIPCSIVSGCQRFGAVCSLQLQGKNV
jgi:hypothetical protein